MYCLMMATNTISDNNTDATSNITEQDHMSSQTEIIKQKLPHNNNQQCMSMIIMIKEFINSIGIKGMKQLLIDTIYNSLSNIINSMMGTIIVSFSLIIITNIIMYDNQIIGMINGKGGNLAHITICIIFMMASVILLYVYIYRSFYSITRNMIYLESTTFDNMEDILYQKLFDKLDLREISSNIELEKVQYHLKDACLTFTRYITPMLFHAISLIIAYSVILWEVITYCTRPQVISNTTYILNALKFMTQSITSVDVSAETINRLLLMEMFTNSMIYIIISLTIFINITQLILLKPRRLSSEDYLHDIIDNKQTHETLNISSSILRDCKNIASSQQKEANFWNNIKLVLDVIITSCLYLMMLIIFCIIVQVIYYHDWNMSTNGARTILSIYYGNDKEMIDTISPGTLVTKLFECISLVALIITLYICLSISLIVYANILHWNNIKNQLIEFKNIIKSISFLSSVKINTTNFERMSNNHSSISFDNVKIGYSIDIHKSVMNIKKLRLNQGNLYFLLGRSGSGKSTFMNGIRGLCHVHGNILGSNGVSSQSLGKILPSDLLKNIGYAQQEIRFKPNITIQEYFQDLDIIFDYKLAESLLNQYNLINESTNTETLLAKNLGKNGSTLSGGERTRLFMAGLEYTSSDIIMIDESLDSLDVETTALILKRLMILSKTKIIIIVTHKIQQMSKLINSLISYSDKIISTEKLTIDNISLLYAKEGDLQSSIINYQFNDIFTDHLKSIVYGITGEYINTADIKSTYKYEDLFKRTNINTLRMEVAK